MSDCRDHLRVAGMVYVQQTYCFGVAVLKVLGPRVHLKPQSLTVLRNQVPALQKAHRACTTEADLMLFRIIIPVYHENRTGHTNPLSWRSAVFK